MALGELSKVVAISFYYYFDVKVDAVGRVFNYIFPIKALQNFQNMYKLIMEEYKLLINILSARPPRIFLSFSPSFLLSHVDASILKIKKIKLN